MAPGRLSKRPRAQTHDGDSVDGERSKRSRRSYLEESDSSEAESQQSDEESQEAEEQSQQSDAEQDDNDADSEDRFFSRLTQRIEKQLRNDEVRQNVANDAGIIQEISCTNFMCHAQLTVTLGPLINFIIGHNGSGKSAVLTALSLCLGGKASATNRGQNLKSFIKEGTDHCNLRVKIKNEGSNAHQPEKYGKSIYVERHFSRAGTSGFRLKDENKKLVSTKKADLEDILDTFAMQIDNPMNVLTQDMARQFLNDSTPKDKYKFFLKGTQLETLRADYNVILQMLEEMRSKSATVDADVKVLQKRFKAAVAKARRAENLKTMREREHELAHQAAWAKVEGEEAELQKPDTEIARLTRLIERSTVTADEKSEQYEAANRAYSDVNQLVQDLQAEIEPKKQEAHELSETFADTKQKLIAVNQQERDVVGKIANKKRNIDKYEKAIQDQRRLQAEADGGQHAHRLAELEEAKEELERARQDLADHEGGFQRLKKDMQEAQQKASQAGSTVQQKIDDLNSARNLMTELQKGQRDWTQSYPNRNLARILQEIDNERRFRERPVGPMGRHVKLLKPEWSSILESSAAGLLNSFVVTSKQDQVTLSSLLKRFNCDFTVIIGSSREIDTTNSEPDPQVDTWLRVLRIDNTLVRNQLIINQKVEQVVLIKDHEEGQNFMYDRTNLRNVTSCLTMNKFDQTKGHSIFSKANGTSTESPIANYRFRPRMEVDKEAQISAARRNHERLQRELSEAQEVLKDLQVQYKTCKDRLTEHDRRKRGLTIRVQKAESNMERLEAELSAAAPDSGRIEQLEESLAKARDERSFEEGQLDDIVSTKEELNKESRAQKTELEAVQAEITQLNLELGKLDEKSERLRNKREQALRDKNQELELVEQYRENLALWEQHRGRQLEVIRGITEEAEQISPRLAIPAGETYDSITKKLDRVRREREASERELGGSEEDLVYEAQQAKMAYHTKQVEKESLESTMKEMIRAIGNREERWEIFRKEITIRARTTFGYLLSERRFRGTLKVDHINQLLDIHVQPDINVNDSHGRQTKTLSGGEKSFSTICLLLSLWDAMGSPIRCLDEFDVFMDSVNRHESMKLMIAAARRAIGRQYILITPQAMNSFESRDDVKIIKMQDPERGQTALNISR